MSWLAQIDGPAAFLALGFVIGMAHALEADHLAAVATFANEGDGRARMIARGALWGLGHTTALFVICSVVVLAGLTISGRLEAALEGAVGVMIVVLGLRVLWKMRRDRVHLHVHSHGAEKHIHLHSHAGETVPHGAHDHGHRQRAMVFGIGLLHGAAGSAGLLVLTVAAADSIAQALGYFALFGLGSLAGMAALSFVASYPLGLIGRGAGWMQTATALAIGALALFVGGSIVVHSFPAIVAASL
jgi:hypothetical protein